MDAEQALYRRFSEARQEPLRLSAALTGFFLDDMEEDHRQAYGAYLQRRIRPAAAALIEAEDTDKLARLEALGWFTGQMIDECIQTARKQKKPAALVWLLQVKREKYGFADREFLL